MYLGKATLVSGKLDLGLVSAGSNGFEPKGRFLQIDTKVIISIICVVRFIQFVVPAKPCRFSHREKSSVLLTISVVM